MAVGSNSAAHAPIRLLVWTFVAFLAVLAFSSAILKQEQRLREHSLYFLNASPQQGRDLFREKGCVRCHSVNGIGGKVGPDLGRVQISGDLASMVAAMWNHAPTMWERMRAEGISYPDLDYEDVAHLLSYLYSSHHADIAGDAAHGRDLFMQKKCDHCHRPNAVPGPAAPELASLRSAGPLDWSAALWDHAPKMLQSGEEQHLAWPQYQTGELRDLYAYAHSGPTGEPLGDPERGWQIFQQKSCAGCHSLRSGYELQGHNLGPGEPLPATYSELSAAMLSHFPQMQKAMAERGTTVPQLSAQDMADVFAFLYSLRYVDPSGSPEVGASVFEWRGCSRCHGKDAEGTSHAPPLRGRNYNSIALGVALWQHGHRMYAETKNVGLGWPTLEQEDIGDLLAFLNLPATQKK